GFLFGGVFLHGSCSGWFLSRIETSRAENGGGFWGVHGVCACVVVRLGVFVAEALRMALVRSGEGGASAPL
ncbi:hypothetical protein OFC87_37625, partial [Escherichia coli]|nr:hypothetical protein [Escherichia coli]